ncbi:MAG TPA: DUF2442 domain-containing protein [Clostridiales bacterium UBA8960]|nr:DUF2442 domain-containing protein [Clostridiales bacterium UBA8960]
MLKTVKDVKVMDNYELLLMFDNGEERIFDMKPYLDKGIYKSLRDVKLFNTARVSFDSVEWSNCADIDPEFLYIKSVMVSDNKTKTD